MSIESVMPSNHLILSSPSPPALSLSQHQCLFQWVSSSHQVAKVLGVSASTSVLPMNTQDQSPLGWTGWISLQSKGLSRVFSDTTVQKHQFFSSFFTVQLSHPYMTTGKTIALTRWTFVYKVTSLLFNILFRLVITSLPRSECLNFMASINICCDFRAKKNKVSNCFHCFPIYLPWSNGNRCHDVSFLNVEP